ncbi:MAG: class I SAM-dependent rRNA methyltransferase [Acidobacteriota bacterium]
MVLKPGEDRRLRSGHLWVFSNEVQAHPAAGSGEAVEVVADGGRSLGLALYHPHSLISARLLGVPPGTELDVAFFSNRIREADLLRARLMPEETSVRLVHGESDFLPGLIVDRYGEYFVVQALCAGMDCRLDLVVEALVGLYQPKGVIERNEVALRDYEELPRRKSVLYGSWEGPVEIEEAGLRYRVDLLEGQKTGFFLDQKWNRQAVARLCQGRTVLDCFCHAGGFALHAARSGAAAVTAVDASAPSLELAAANARLNAFDGVTFVASDVFSFLEEAAANGRTYDVVILDPPSFAPRRKDLPRAWKAYRKLNELGLRCVSSGGILASASCSHHLPEEEFFRAVMEAATRCGRRLQLLERRGAAPDHPVLPAMPETAYLKFGLFLVR